MSQEPGHDADRKFLLTFGVVIIGLIVAVISFVIIANLFASNQKTGIKSPQFLSPDQRAKRVPPHAARTSGSAGKGRSGQQVVEQVRAACHTTKFMNAPQIGNKAEWAPRARKGMDTLVTHALKGFGNLSPQGGSVSSQEEHAALKHMVEEKTGIQLK